LRQILERPLEDRFADHQKGSLMVKDFVEKKLGLRTIPKSREESANGMTAIWIPEGVKLPELLPKIASKQVVFAGGLHKEIASESPCFPSHINFCSKVFPYWTYGCFSDGSGEKGSSEGPRGASIWIVGGWLQQALTTWWG